MGGRSGLGALSLLLACCGLTVGAPWRDAGAEAPLWYSRSDLNLSCPCDDLARFGWRRIRYREERWLAVADRTQAPYAQDLVWSPAARTPGSRAFVSYLRSTETPFPYGLYECLCGSRETAVARVVYDPRCRLFATPGQRSVIMECELARDLAANPDVRFWIQGPNETRRRGAIGVSGLAGRSRVFRETGDYPSVWAEARRSAHTNVYTAVFFPEPGLRRYTCEMRQRGDPVAARSLSILIGPATESAGPPAAGERTTWTSVGLAGLVCLATRRG
ncbi:t9 [Tupaiid betaherpesvirus 1]|uniref:T9 n=1 Tax=Tupaiid herpesvirus 1 (strain 1) TaxID=10397 RepID=Q91TV4_TUHV1|nr:t9 [Tupaiid betaherpesvirus 1]AAK57033.1 t9 [Tupaiid betaherpesvirus 1]